MVISILYFYVCTQFNIRWSGNAEDSAKHNFGMWDMGAVVDTLENTRKDIAKNDKIMLIKDCIMKNFSSLQNKIDHFYLTFIYMNQMKAMTIKLNPSTCHMLNCTFPWDRKLPKQIVLNKIVWGHCNNDQLWDAREENEDYLSNTTGNYSKAVAVVTKEELHSLMCLMVHKSILLSTHVISKILLLLTERSLYIMPQWRVRLTWSTILGMIITL